MLLFKDLYFYEWEEKKETIIYSIPLVFVFFIWIWARFGEEKSFQFKLIGIDIVVVGLAAVRILGWLFHSGHVLFLVYTFFTTKNITYRILCIPMIAITVYIKYSWGDFVTPILGGVIGVFFIFLRKKLTSPPRTK